MSSNGTRDDSAPPAPGAAEDLAILQEADAPIQRRAEDRLNRRRFAETVGRALAGWNQDRSLTVALFGPGGCGKTSIVNMALEWIEQECPAPKPAVLRFNPWEWSSQDALFRAFFDEVAKKLLDIRVWNAIRDILRKLFPLVEASYRYPDPSANDPARVAKRRNPTRAIWRSENFDRYFRLSIPGSAGNADSGAMSPDRPAAHENHDGSSD